MLCLSRRIGQKVTLQSRGESKEVTLSRICNSGCSLNITGIDVTIFLKKGKSYQFEVGGSIVEFKVGKSHFHQSVKIMFEAPITVNILRNELIEA